MDPYQEHLLMLNRRQFFGPAAGGIGAAALASLLEPSLKATAPPRVGEPHFPPNGLPDLPHFAPHAKRVIYLFQSGGPSQMELFDYKPKLQARHGTELPDSVRGGQRITGMTSWQTSLPCVASMFRLQQHGAAGRWVSELLPHTASSVDDICVIKSMHTEAINHDPAITFINTGNQQPGKPSMGSWLSYGIGCDTQNLPAYVVLVSKGTGRPVSQPIPARVFSNGFLPSNDQGVRFRAGKDPVLFLSDPPGMDRASRRRILDGLARLNGIKSEDYGDPEIHARIAQYEMAYRMQTSLPELTDLSSENGHTLEMYGPDVTKPGSYAANCLLARRMAERGVRFIQLFHRGWDQHDNLPKALRLQCQDTDQPTAALIHDLKQRGMLDETLVIWGGEFGRTVYCQGKLTKDDYGRDHHGRCFTTWLSGGGVRPGIEYGETDDYCYNIVRDPVHVHDLNATILHCLGIDHERFTYRFKGLAERLTGVEPASVVHDILT